MQVSQSQIVGCHQPPSDIYETKEAETGGEAVGGGGGGGGGGVDVMQINVPAPFLICPVRARQ